MDEQLNLFDMPTFSTEKKIRLIELFAGMGTQAQALNRLGVDFEHHFVCEFDKYAMQVYNAIHCTNFETSDVTQIHATDLNITEKDKYTYILTYSFPCQSLSLAGKQEGMAKGSGTRSGLLWEVERLLNECKELPDVLLMENVPQVHSEKNINDFESWLSFLRSKGYHNFYQDINAKTMGVPQNRDRCFCISILSDDFVEYEFPKEIKLPCVMKDYLEPVVDEKYYINSPKATELIKKLVVENKIKEETTVDLCLKNPKKIEVANCIKARVDAGISNLQSDGSGVIEPSASTIFMKNMVDKTKDVEAEKIDVAGTLMARDYKGINNFGMNGVIECQK